jgi:hypothetical protein
VRFGHFFEDLGYDAAQTPALLNFDTDALCNGFRGVEVIQIGHVGFRTVLLDRFAHGQLNVSMAGLRVTTPATAEITAAASERLIPEA